jgi:hypothetical protein
MIIGRLLTEGQFPTLLSPDQVALQIRSGLLAQIGAPLEHSRRVMGITTRRSWRPPPPSAISSTVWNRPPR